MKTTRKCPICDWEIKDGGKRVRVGDRFVVVCCDECAAKARSNLKTVEPQRSKGGA